MAQNDGFVVLGGNSHRCMLGVTVLTPQAAAIQDLPGALAAQGKVYDFSSSLNFANRYDIMLRTSLTSSATF